MSNSLKNLEVGDTLPINRVKIDSKIYKKYNRLINEINPLHFNKKYAQKLGFEDIVVAGNFNYTFIPKWIIDWTGIVDSIKEIKITFEKPVYINEEIIHSGRIKDIYVKNNEKIAICEFNVKKINGQQVYHGKIKLLIEP
ncbi:MAG: hypothetical protein GF329_14530 [Candidatus Lokiarchaeota archaeon]|nr:hypothetical protein [Candidatus Lokiarchaeota archaeon]